VDIDVTPHDAYARHLKVLCPPGDLDLNVNLTPISDTPKVHPLADGLEPGAWYGRTCNLSL
jgi:hypothetical protein